MNIFKKVINMFKGNVSSSKEPYKSKSSRQNQEHVMSPDEKVDEASEESMIASDPPGHISKSTEDRNLH